MIVDTTIKAGLALYSACYLRVNLLTVKAVSATVRLVYSLRNLIKSAQKLCRDASGERAEGRTNPGWTDGVAPGFHSCRLEGAAG